MCVLFVNKAILAVICGFAIGDASATWAWLYVNHVRVVLSQAALIGASYTLPFSGMTSFNYVQDIADIFIK